MSRKARQYQDLGECRRCRQWRKVDTRGLCVHCRYLSTGGTVVREKDHEDAEPRESVPVEEVIFS